MYTRRYVTIDKKGRKHVTFRSMGDAAVDPGVQLDAGTPAQTASQTSAANCPAGQTLINGVCVTVAADGTIVPTAPVSAPVPTAAPTNLLAGTIFDPTTWGKPTTTTAPDGTVVAAAPGSAAAAVAGFVGFIPGAPAAPGDTDYRPYVVAGAVGVVGYMLLKKKRRK